MGSDHLGTPKIVTDNTGAAKKIWEYDSWGVRTTILDNDPTFDLPVGFAGGIPDDATGLVRFGFRDYEPGTGRWAAKDPIFLRGGLNLYVYVENDPINSIDPTGLIEPGSMGHHPPGWNDQWTWGPRSRSGPGNSWWDSKGGEWRWGPSDKYHPEGHWDHNPWDSWNSKWQNVPGDPPPVTPTIPPVVPPILGPPVFWIFINPCTSDPSLPICPKNCPST